MSCCDQLLASFSSLQDTLQAEFWGLLGCTPVLEHLHLQWEGSVPKYLGHGDTGLLKFRLEGVGLFGC